MSPRAASLSSIAMALVICAGAAMARSSDRSKPMDVDAASQSCTLDDNGQCTFTGDVLIVQGTLNIRAAKAVVHRAGGDPSRAVLTGSPAVLRQELDDGTPMTARASTIDYNVKTEVVVLTGNVSVEQPRGNMSGQNLVYNLKTGQVDSGGTGGRVKVRFQPRQGAAPAPKGKG